MLDLSSHYKLLLGLSSPWQVDGVDLQMESKRVDIKVSHRGGYNCPDCGAESSLYDHAPARSWRHLDTMQFETIIHARVPRCSCEKCGVKTVSTPWASGKKSRFTLLFEAFAIEVLLHSSNVTAACKLLKINWHSADSIMQRAVERGLSRRKETPIKYLGIDEKSFGRHHRYVTVLNNLESGSVIEVVEDRTKEASEKVLNSLSDSQKQGVEAIAMDFWKAFIGAAENVLPEATIVHDRFHISKYLNDAVDKVRRKEHKELFIKGDKTLSGSKFHWLQNRENMTDKRRKQFDALMEINLKTGEAWALKQQFQEFWQQTNLIDAFLVYNSWMLEVKKRDLKPMTKVADMLKRHCQGIFSYITEPISNGVSEGLNSKIQLIKSAARGLRTFQSYRRRILFFCGKLEMSPVFH